MLRERCINKKCKTYPIADEKCDVTNAVHLFSVGTYCVGLIRKNIQ